MMIDTHAHVHFNAYKADMDEVIKRSLNKGVIMNLVGTQSDTSQRGIEVAEKYDGVYASIGLHPEHLFSKHVDEEETSFQSREESFDYEYYKKLAQHPKVIGIGECGMDFYRIPEGMTKEQMLPRQKEVFLQHIKLAQEMDLPMVIHCREAHSELIEVLTRVNGERDLSLPSPLPRRGGDGDSFSPQQRREREERSRVLGTIHCYTSNWQNAQKYLSMGFYIGFTGVITFPPLKANPQAQFELLEVVRQMPLDRILLETDCPYLSPVPYRGKRGEPWMVEATAQKIAELRGMSLEEVMLATTENAKRLFTKID
ncbi:MAG: TatD family deoxyribonuclease [Candidatus Magasanikbacteria bacterium]|nr:TatD family deoxyribonuclease [Candidatus Magasanikbacteria bacterium]